MSHTGTNRTLLSKDLRARICSQFHQDPLWSGSTQKLKEQWALRCPQKVLDCTLMSPSVPKNPEEFQIWTLLEVMASKLHRTLKPYPPQDFPALLKPLYKPHKVTL